MALLRASRGEFAMRFDSPSPTFVSLKRDGDAFDMLTRVAQPGDARQAGAALTREEFDDAVQLVRDATRVLGGSRAEVRPNHGGAKRVKWPSARGETTKVLSVLYKLNRALVALGRRVASARYPLPDRALYQDGQPTWLRAVDAGLLGARAPRQAARLRPLPAGSNAYRGSPANAANNAVADGDPAHGCKPLGKGGFSTVSVCRLDGDLIGKIKSAAAPAVPRLRSGQLVAIKRIGATPDLVPFYRREADTQRVLSRTFAFVPKVLASWYRPKHGAHGGVFYIVMQRVRGETLCDYLRRSKRAVPRELFCTIERVVASLWMAGVAHGDLNPNNIILTPSGGVTLIDFGLAVWLPATMTPKTMREAVSKGYQSRLLAYLDRVHATTRLGVTGRMAHSGDPQVLRWLWQFVR